MSTEIKVEDDGALATAMRRAELAEASVERLKCLVAMLERERGETAAMVMLHGGGIIVCAPGCDERRLVNMLLGAAAAWTLGAASTLLCGSVGQETADAMIQRAVNESPFRSWDVHCAGSECTGDPNCTCHCPICRRAANNEDKEDADP